MIERGREGVTERRVRDESVEVLMIDVFTDYAASHIGTSDIVYATSLLVQLRYLQ